MKRFKEWLVAENVKRLGQGDSVAEPFYPSDFLRGDDGGSASRAAASGARTQRQRVAVADDFSRFVFIKATVDDIDALVNANRGLGLRCSLRHYRDTDGCRACVPARTMEAFFDACLRHRGYFEVVPPLNGIEAMDRVEIKTGPFAGQQASVVRVSQAGGHVHLDLELELVNGVISIRMKDVDRSDVAVLNRSTVDAIRTDFIEYTQTHLLDIMEHRVKGVTDADVRRRDVAMLTRLLRYRHHKVENDAARLHFQALMLICAHLCRYADEEQQLLDDARTSLDALSRRAPSKAATDTRAYLWVALYVATRDPAYREWAKEYVREHQPKSDRLRRFVSLIRTGKRF